MTAGRRFLDDKISFTSRLLEDNSLYTTGRVSHDIGLALESLGLVQIAGGVTMNVREIHCRFAPSSLIVIQRHEHNHEEYIQGGTSMSAPSDSPFDFGYPPSSNSYAHYSLQDTPYNNPHKTAEQLYLQPLSPSYALQNTYRVEAERIIHSPTPHVLPQALLFLNGANRAPLESLPSSTSGSNLEGLAEDFARNSNTYIRYA